MTNLTRYRLFLDAWHYLEDEESLIKMDNREKIAHVFEMSALLIYKLEPTTGEGQEEIYPSRDEFYRVFEGNKNNGRVDREFATYVERALEEKQKDHKEKEIKRLSYKELLATVFNAITDYQNETLTSVSFKDSDSNSVVNVSKLPQTFLCYAYLDRGFTLALFIYFLINGGFLYVNWMWCGANNNGSITKPELEKELKKSSQFLFLRTTSSELRVRGNYTIRQWCSWEIGNYYTKKPGEKYYVSFYNSSKIRNDILDTFKIMKYVSSGKIVS